MPVAIIRPSRRRGLVAALLFGALLGSAGPAPAAGEAAFQHAFELFSEASSGHGDAVEPAAEAFDALLQAEPGNPVLMAYAGSSTALQATRTLLPWKKMSYAEDGLAQIDKALAILKPQDDAAIEHGTPGSLEVRYVAAVTFLAVPGFMNRAARGSKLLNEVLASPLFATAPLLFRGTVWMRAATLALKEGRAADAQRYLNQVIAGNAPQAAAARALLKGAPA